MANQETGVMRKNYISGKAVMALLFAAAIWMIVTPVSDARADYDQSKRWFEAQSSSTRSALQDALFWSGEYSGPIDARFGSQTYASLTDFQRRRGVAPTGVLRASERAALLKEGQRIRQLVYSHSRRVSTAPNRGRRAPEYTLALPILILP